MILLSLSLHGNDLGQEKQTLIDVLTLLLSLTGSTCVAHAPLITRVRAVRATVWAWVSDSRADRHASFTRRIMDVCSLGAGKIDKV